MFFYFFISNIINIVGKKRLLIIWMTIGGTFAGALYWISNFYLILLALLMIAALGNCIGIMITIAIEYYPININAMGVTLVMMVGRLGAVTGTNVIGPLLLNNCNTMFFSYAGIIGFLILLGFFLPK
uniref:Major facilitator superfamily (MFS) profile domain-containing protein n=1 Tax=Megaselia scalaris TaxID=36166 RepID=T1GWN8_MEGSC